MQRPPPPRERLTLNPDATYRKHYGDAQARHYAHAKQAAVATHRGEAALVARALRNVPRDETLLDLPCGAARMTAVLAQLGFTKLAAADVSPAMVELARARLADDGIDAQVTLADAEHLPFADRSFDNVFCFRLFHHFPSEALRATVLAELARVARQRVVISYLDTRSFTSRKRAFERLFKPRPASKFTQTPREFAALLARAGLEVVADHARVPLWHSLRLVVARPRAAARNP